MSESSMTDNQTIFGNFGKDWAVQNNYETDEEVQCNKYDWRIWESKLAL